MPQMEFADYAPQLIWLLITFSVLYVLMARVALPRIAEVLEAREQRITNDIERAERLGLEAKAAELEYERISTETRNNAQVIAADMRAKVQAEQMARLGELEEKLAADGEKAEASIAEAQNQALNSLHNLAADLAQAAAGKLLDERIDNAKAVQAVDAELRKG